MTKTDNQCVKRYKYNNKRIKTRESEGVMSIVSSICCACILVVLVGSAILFVQAADPSTWVYDSNKEISDISISSDGSVILVGGERIYCFSEEGAMIWNEWSCDQITTSSDGEYIVYSKGNTLTLKNINGTLLWEKNIGKITDIAITPNGWRIIASDIGCNVYFFNRTGELIAQQSVMHEDVSRMEDLKITGNGLRVIVLTDKGWYYLTVNGGMMRKQEDDLDESVWGNGGSLVEISSDGGVFVIKKDYDLKYYRDGSLAWKNRFKDPITCIALSSEGSYLAIGSQDNAIHFLNSEGKELWKYNTGFWIRDIDITSDGSTIIAGSMDNQAYIFDTDGTVLAAIDAGGWVDHVGITPDGSFAVAASKQTVVGISTSNLRLGTDDENAGGVLKPEAVQPPVISNEPTPFVPADEMPSFFSDVYSVITVALIILAAWLFVKRLM
jgi:WD40 repeat protein